MIQYNMEKRRPRRTRALPTHLREYVVEGISSIRDPCELSQLAAVIRLDHSYSYGLEERYLKNTAILPEVRPAATVSSVAPLLQQEDSVSIHGCSIQGYQDIYHSVAEPVMKISCSRPRPYSLELGLEIKQRLWETLNRPSLVETEQPDGRILITESFSNNNRSFAPRIHVDISEEPLPEEPRRKKPRH
ncbi:hypothetical protein Q8A67_020877 [Cirrhinus molitorella]|uniref:Uncharacterized protein n=1 Tax=Cirrhinus molitorella TaxID=172907 RepID=A0AA88PE95_9TELE|nr:hypothetical protein Q8A67_020877 [Cirrhinus molitorella]